MVALINLDSLNTQYASTTTWHDQDFKIEWYNGTIKAGGQHHQKNATCCRITHIPSGIVRTAQTRSRQNSLQAAMTAIKEDLTKAAKSQINQKTNNILKQQIGTSTRNGQKGKTWRFQENTVTTSSGKSARISEVLKGQFNLLWD